MSKPWRRGETACASHPAGADAPGVGADRRRSVRPRRQRDLEFARFRKSIGSSSHKCESSRQTESGDLASASYGVVSGNASHKDVSSNSAREAQRLAQRNTQETISRAVTRLEERRLVRRQVTTTEELREENLHQFTGTQELLIGVYRHLIEHSVLQSYSDGARMFLGRGARASRRSALGA